MSANLCFAAVGPRSVPCTSVVNTAPASNNFHSNYFKGFLWVLDTYRAHYRITKRAPTFQSQRHLEITMFPGSVMHECKSILVKEQFCRAWSTVSPEVTSGNVPIKCRGGHKTVPSAKIIEHKLDGSKPLLTQEGQVQAPCNRVPVARRIRQRLQVPFSTCVHSVPATQ